MTGHDLGRRAVICPSCGHATTDEPVCPVCGIVFAKMRGPRPTPPTSTRNVEPVGDEEPGRPRWPFVLLGVVLIAGAGLAVKGRKPAAAPVQEVAAEPPTVLPRDAEPPPPVVAAEAPAPIEEMKPEVAGVPQADQARATSLVQRLNARSAIYAADVDFAEDLFARFQGDDFLRDLLEGVLVAKAEQERASRLYAPAAAHLQRAIAVQPGGARTRLVLVQLMLEAEDWAGAESAARSVLSLEPRHRDALLGLGYALMRQDRNAEAAEALQAALDVQDDAPTRSLLARIRKGMDDEKGMTQQQLSHFHVRYDGDTHDAVGREILRVLERHYATLAGTLDHQPAAAIPVILFSREAYYNASGAPAWSGGIYDGIDGRIRIPIGGLSASLTPDMDSTLIHELTHAFVADRTRGVAPRDIQEGLAQYMEGKRLGSELSREQLRAFADGRVGGVGGYYLAALSFVEHLIAQRGMGGMNDLLKAMGETGDVDEAFQKVEGRGYAAARADWVGRLRQQHGS
jgi:tetratricopeptide (TPR) repeat protein